jgi:pyruvyltransferase
MIKLYAWGDHPNFGDMLSASVVEWVSGQQIKLVEASATNKLIAVGSVLQHAKPGDVVWGTGIHPLAYESIWRNYKKDTLDYTVLAVRGPLTRDILLARKVACPEVFGDPGILLPLMYPKKLEPQHELAIIPHFSEHKRVAPIAASHRVEVIDASSPWRSVVDKIVKAKRIVSGSLHGIIVAEAYGIPATWYRAGHSEGMIKYADYYLGTGRIPRPFYDIEEALHHEPPPPPDFTAQQLGLCAAFHGGHVAELCSTEATPQTTSPALTQRNSTAIE